MLERQCFIECGDTIANHPFLQAAAKGEHTYGDWTRYFSARLEAGPGFVQFLDRLREQASRQNYPEIAKAAEKNRQEELGIVDGETVIDRAHSTWRSWFRAGISRVFQEQSQTQIPTSPVPDFTEVNGYGALFRELDEHNDPLESMGALAVLEIGLGREYEQVLKGLDTLFDPALMTAREWTYLRSHAIHDLRHFEETWQPLEPHCANDRDVARITLGARRALAVKVDFLNGAGRK